MSLEIENYTFSYGTEPVLRGLNLHVDEPKFVALIGPNAAGKSTFLKCLAGVLVPEGAFRFRGEQASQWSHGERRDRVSYLPQAPPDRISLSVFECVLLGWLNRLSWHVSDSELEQVMETLELLNMAELAERPYGELSGGQKQMVGIAQALVKIPELLLMDEPVAGLDLHHRLDILEHVQLMTRQQGLYTVLALHDLNLASRFADEIVVLNGGRVYGQGLPGDVVNETMLREVYEVEADVEKDKQGVPHVRLRRSLGSKP